MVPASSSTPRSSPATTRRAPSLDGLAVEGYPTAAELAGADWQPLLPLSTWRGDTHNAFPVESDRRVTHVRLTIHPDGGVARLRVHGTPVAGPAAARRRAGRPGRAGERRRWSAAAATSSTGAGPADLPRAGPGHGRGLGDRPAAGRRQRLGGGAAGLRRAWCSLAELDTSYFLRQRAGRGAADRLHRGPLGPNGPTTGWSCCRGPGCSRTPGTASCSTATARRSTDVRLDVFPDGGMARLRLWGRPTAAGRSPAGAALVRRAARRPGARGARRGRRAAAGRPPGRAPAADGDCRPRRPGCSTAAS